jgi:hypothetical protein
MRKLLGVALAAAALVFVNAGPAFAAVQQIRLERGLSAVGLFTNTSGSVTTTVFVNATARSLKLGTPAPSGQTTSLAAISFSQSDSATGDQISGACYWHGNVPPDLTIPDSALSVSQNLKSASLQGDFDCYGPPEGPFPVTLNLNWTGSGATFATASPFKINVPGIVVTGVFQGVFGFGATGSGTATYGGTTYTVTDPAAVIFRFGQEDISIEQK